jgi:hypothetical protein
MDFLAWVTVLRLPIEIASAGLAIAPALLLLRAWSSLPSEIPVHFGFSGSPDRWGGRFQSWILPVVGLGLYVAFSSASGTWGWLLGGKVELPPSMAPLLLMRLPIGMLMTYITWGTIRVALKQAESLDWRILWSLVLLTVAPGPMLPFLLH